MKTALQDIRKAAINEYRRASEKFGPNNSGPHESYAVILEEYEEAKDEAVLFSILFDKYWQGVKKHKKGADRAALDQVLNDMQQHAEQTAAEWIQVAAMCLKAKAIKGSYDYE